MNLMSALVGIGLLAISISHAQTMPANAHEPMAVALDLKALPLLVDVAPAAVQISPHVPDMGAHWADSAVAPEGPFYCVIEGRVVCVEFMFTAAQLAAGENWRGLLPGIATPPISHVDVEFLPEGIPHRAEPLYQLHLYFAGPTLLAD